MKYVYRGGEGEIVEKKSRFIATVRPIETEEEALDFIGQMKKKYWNATHNCFAYVAGEHYELQRCSDDGEPQGTAGRPMLDVLLGEGIHNAAVVVTRYFGGTLLGTGGLVRAYSKAVQEGLRYSVVIDKEEGFLLKIGTDYTGIGKIQYLLGKEGMGFMIAMKTLDESRAYVGAGAVGIAQRAIDEAVKYSKQRVTFGKPISNHQAIQFMLADMDIKTSTARSMVAEAVLRQERKLPYAKESAIAKCYAGDIAVQVALDAIQILGGYGYSREYPVEKLLRDAKIFQIYEGTNQIQRMVIAKNVIKGK